MFTLTFEKSITYCRCSRACPPSDLVLQTRRLQQQRCVMRCQTGRPAAPQPWQPQPGRGGEAPDVGRRGVHPQLERVRHRSHGPQRQPELQEHHGRSAKMHHPPSVMRRFPPFDAYLNLQASGIHRLVWETVPEWECTPLSTSS